MPHSYLIVAAPATTAHICYLINAASILADQEIHLISWSHGSAIDAKGRQRHILLLHTSWMLLDLKYAGAALSCR